MRTGIPAALLLAALPAARAGAEGPEGVVKALYTAYLRTPLPGLPSEAEMKPLSPYLSSGLLRLFEDARSYQARYAKQHPEDKPPFVDGDLFSSLFEGPTAFAVGSVETEPDGRARVWVAFSRDDPSSPGGVLRWKDAVLVTREKDRFVIDDILFLGDWPFKVGDRLRAVLKSRD